MEECIEYEDDGETPTPGVEPWFEKSSKSVYDNDKYPLPAKSRVPPRDSWEVKGSGIGPPPRVYLTSADLPSINDYKEQTTGASYKLYYLSKYGEKSQIPSNKVIITALKACGIPPSIFKSNETTHISLVAQLLKLVKQTMKTLKPDIQWRESEVLMNIKSNNLQLYNCIRKSNNLVVNIRSSIKSGVRMTNVVMMTSLESSQLVTNAYLQTNHILVLLTKDLFGV